MHIVSIEGIKLFAYHGCLEEEALIGRHYTVDVHVETDFTDAANNDDLTKTIDYVTINSIVQEEMAIRSKLIEAVAGRIIKRIRQEFNSVYGTTVCIKKMSPPVSGDVEWVSVTISE